MTERKMQRRTMHDFIMREAAVCGRMKPKEPHPMSEKPGDWAELAARADARALPPSDYGSTRAIQSVAALLRAAYERGQAEAIAAWNRRAGGEGWQATHRHRKGGLYRVITRGEIEADLTPCVIYDDAAGRVWVRPVAEFDDGRFAPAAPGDEG